MAPGRGSFYAGSLFFQKFADSFGLPIDQLNFLVAQIGALIFSIGYRIFLHPSRVSVTVRHVISLCMGFLIGYFCFGYQISHMVVQSTLVYILMTSADPHVMHWLVLFVSILYLSSMHLLRIMYDYGGWTLDITGPLMVATQKVTSVAFNLHDGLLKVDEKLSTERKRQAIRRRPTMLEFYSYVFQYQSMICGPLVFYNDYKDFIEGKQFARHAISASSTPGDTKKILEKEPSPTKEVIYKASLSLFFALCLVVVVPLFPVEYLKDGKFVYETSYFVQMMYILVCTSLQRIKYYCGWLLGDAVSNAAGLGFNGFTSNGEGKWDLITNVEILSIEFSSNFKEFLDTWNKSTQTWLKIIIYDRVQSNRILKTYILSAVWHGFYPGYYFSFLSGALSTIAARSVRRCARPYFLVTDSKKMFYDILTMLATRLTVAYIIFPFVILEFEASLRLYWNFFFAGHFLFLLAIYALPVILPPKKSTGKRSAESSLPSSAALPEDKNLFNGKVVNRNTELKKEL